MTLHDVYIFVGILASLVTVVGIIISAVWWGIAKPFSLFTAKFTIVDARLNGMDTRLDKVDMRIDGVDTRLGGMDKRLDKVDMRLEKVDMRLEKIEGSIRDLINYMREKHVSESLSPISLTEYGLKLKKQINVDALITKHSDELKIPDGWNEYKIQEACFDFAYSRLFDLLSDDEREFFEKTAFDEGISTRSLLHVCGISLRDHKLKSQGKSHGKSIGNTDKHAAKRTASM